MNTKQKLTLGIAAIFMVTLTIVGVTYAYFVTRVNGETTESVNINTASVGSVEYQAGNGTEDYIKLEKVLPGTFTYKTFKVVNTTKDANGTPSNYNLVLEATPGAINYVHSTKTDDLQTTCYVSSASQTTAECFDGTAYNNIYITLYKITKDQFEAAALANRADTDTTAIADETTALGTDIKVATKNVLTTANVNTAKTTDTLLSNVSIASNKDGNETDYYALKVEYRSVDANQNIENEAGLTLKVTIS